MRVPHPIMKLLFNLFRMVLAVPALLLLFTGVAGQQETGLLDSMQNWNTEFSSTDSSFAYDDYNGYQIPGIVETLKGTTKAYSKANRKILSITNLDESLPPAKVSPDNTSTFIMGLVATPLEKETAFPTEQSDSKKNDSHGIILDKRWNKKHYGGKSKYDPALILMGLGKRKYNYDPAFRFMGLGKREFAYDPAFRYMGLGKKKHDFDPALRYMGLGKRDANDSFPPKHTKVVKRSIKDHLLNKGTSDYPPVMAFTGMMRTILTHRNPQNSFENLANSTDSKNPDKIFDSTLKHKRSISKNNYLTDDQNLKSSSKEKTSSNELSGRVGFKDDLIKTYTGMEGESDIFNDLLSEYAHYSNPIENKESIKHDVKYNPELKYTGLGKKDFSYEPAINYMGLGKWEEGFQSSKKGSYDPALKYMGLGKRVNNLAGQSAGYDPALKFMGLGKRVNDHVSLKKNYYDPALKYMGLGKRENNRLPQRSSYDPALRFMGLGKRDNDLVTSKKSSYDPAFKYMGLGKRESNRDDQSALYDPALMSMGLGKRESNLLTSKKISYDRVLKYMGRGKGKNNRSSRSASYDPALNYMGLGKRENNRETLIQSSYDPAFKYMGLGKREDNQGASRHILSYDPALKYMGLGKREDNRGASRHILSYDPALKYMGLGKREDNRGASRHISSYDPALKYMGLGKREDNRGASRHISSYDPALKYMGLGKRESNREVSRHISNFDPALKYMGLGKREDNRGHLRHISSYDPALKYMGLGKRDNNRGDSRHISSYDPALKYMGLGKRVDNRGASRHISSYDPALKYMGLGKREDNRGALRHISNFDPALKYMGLGKRENNRGTSRHISNYDPALKYMGLGKRGDNQRALKHISNFDPALKYMGLGKRENNRGALRHISNYDPALKYMGLGKRENNRGVSREIANYDPALKYMGLEKRENNPQISHRSIYDPAIRYMGLGKREYYLDVTENNADQNKQKYKSDSALKHRVLGLEKKLDDDLGKKKRPNRFDPALRFMGLGKRDGVDHRTISIDAENERQPGTKTVKELVTYFDSENPISGEEDGISMASSIDIEGTENNGNEKEKSVASTLTSLEKRKLEDDSGLNYKEPGKQNFSQKPEFEVLSLSNDFAHTNLQKCTDNCKRSSRRKRDLNDEKSSTFSSMNYVLNVDDPQNELLNGIQLNNVESSHINKVRSVKRNIKRDRDNRPRYNPGWVFIGLGKRSPKEQEPRMLKNRQPDLRITLLDQAEYLLPKCYRLLEQIKEKFQTFQNRLTIEDRKTNKNWMPLYEYFTVESSIGGSENPLERMYRVNIKHPSDYTEDANLFAFPYNIDSSWKSDIVSSV